MAVTSVKKQSAKSTSKRGQGGKTASDVYLVTCDVAPTSPVVIETATDGVTAIPAVGNEHDDDAARLVTTITPAALDGTRLTWLVTVEYSSSETTLVDPGTSPLDEDPTTKWDFSAASKPYFIDATGVYSLNTAGEPFENLLERETGELVVTFSKNIAPATWASLAPDAVTYMSGLGEDPDDDATAVNADAFVIDGIGIGEGQARFAGISCGEIQRRNGIAYRTLQITLKLRKSWNDRIDSRGFNELSAGSLKEIVKGTPPVKVDKSWPLDVAGAALGSPDAAPALVILVPYPSLSFSIWGFE
jgi:hypothetical protein